MSQTRIPAAIVFTYIVGDGVLMGNNDRKVFDILSKNQEKQKSIIEELNGSQQN